MKVKLGFRVALLTGMLLLLVSTFKTQPAACSPCTDQCYSAWVTCIENGSPPTVCSEIKDACKSRCPDD
jgi:hypothetical protein